MTERIDEFDSVALLTPIAAGEIAVSHLPAGEGLKRGDEGAVVDALYGDRGWVTVEFSRNGKTVAVTDVPLTCLRLLWKAPAATPAPEPAQRTADLTCYPKMSPVTTSGLCYNPPLFADRWWVRSMFKGDSGS